MNNKDADQHRPAKIRLSCFAYLSSDMYGPSDDKTELCLRQAINAQISLRILICAFVVRSLDSKMVVVTAAVCEMISSLWVRD